MGGLRPMYRAVGLRKRLVSMQTLSSSATEVEQLFARGRTRAVARAQGRERAVERVTGAVFLVVALGMAVFLDSPRDLDVPTLGVLVLSYVVACRAKFDIADGYTVPTELVLV